jgi:hypothetical protein
VVKIREEIIMQEILLLIKESSPVLIIIVIIAFFLKIFIEKRLEGIAGRIEEVNRTSLEIKKGIRGEERGELVKFRVAVEKWEYFLQTALTNYSMEDFSEFQVRDLYKTDKDLFLGVRISIVKSCIYLRNKELENQLLDAVLKIRKNYYPIINLLLPSIIDLKSKLFYYDNKILQFQKSGMKDMAFASTEQDRQESQQLQTELTNKMKTFSTLSIDKYKEIAEQLYDLKETMNNYIYRPIKETAIDKD